MTPLIAHRGLLALTLAAVLCIFLIDLSLPLGFAGGAPYVLAFIVALVLPEQLIQALAIVCAGLTGVGYSASPPPPHPDMLPLAQANRVVAVLAIFAAAWLALRYKKAHSVSSGINVGGNNLALNELAHAQRVDSAGRMAAGLAHELNQPLAAISNYTQVCDDLLEDGAAPNETLREVTQLISEQARRGQTIVSRMKGFVANQQPQRSRVNINEMILDLLPLIQLDYQSAGIEFEARLTDDSPEAIVDRPQLEQVLINVIQNGIDALAQPGLAVRKLTISTAVEEGSQVTVSVQDSGQGIAPEIREKIFAPYFTTKPDGTGLGLAICQSIVEMHGGHLSVISEFEQGTLFQLRLPITITEDSRNELAANHLCCG